MPFFYEDMTREELMLHIQLYVETLHERAVRISQLEKQVEILISLSVLP